MKISLYLFYCGDAFIEWSGLKDNWRNLLPVTHQYHYSTTAILQQYLLVMVYIIALSFCSLCLCGQITIIVTKNWKWQVLHFVKMFFPPKILRAKGQIVVIIHSIWIDTILRNNVCGLPPPFERDQIDFLLVQLITLHQVIFDLIMGTIFP